MTFDVKKGSRCQSTQQASIYTRLFEKLAVHVIVFFSVYLPAISPNHLYEPGIEEGLGKKNVSLLSHE